MSFFGFDTKIPDGLDIDEMLEKKLAYAVDGLEGLEDEDIIEDDNQQLNDETFGAGAEDAGIEYDFSSNQMDDQPEYHSRHVPQNEPVRYQQMNRNVDPHQMYPRQDPRYNVPFQPTDYRPPAPMAFHEIEAQMLKGTMPPNMYGTPMMPYPPPMSQPMHPYMMHQHIPQPDMMHQNIPPPVTGMNLEQVEAAMRQMAMNSRVMEQQNVPVQPPVEVVPKAKDLTKNEPSVKSDRVKKDQQRQGEQKKKQGQRSSQSAEKQETQTMEKTRAESTKKGQEKNKKHVDVKPEEEPKLVEADFPELSREKVLKPTKILQRPKQEPPQQHQQQQQQKQKPAQKQGSRQSNAKSKRKERKLDAADFFKASSYDEDSDDNLPREEKFKGMMRKFEKELIAKIQISNLVSDDPYKDDFYYQIFSVRQNNPTEDPLVPSKDKKGLKSLLQNQLVKSSNSVSNQMEQQMKRLIEKRKQKPQREQVSLAGALGTISVNTVRNPKKAIEVTSTQRPNFEEELSKKSVLRSIEEVYSVLLKLEQFKRQIPDEPEALLEWEENVAQSKSQLFAALHIMEKIPLTAPHPFVCLLNYNKGMKVLTRVFRFMNHDQILAVYSTLLTRLECLDVCNTRLSNPTEEVDMFITHVVPTFAALVSEAGMSVVNGLFRIILERHNILWLAKNKVGLSILTVLLSRAETLKQEGSSEEAEVSLWTEIYNFIFASLQNQFSTLFPSKQTDDEVYLWQFLSAMAVGAGGIEHQRILITEIRENVINTSKSMNTKAMDNVNMFLNALGLGIDASQLASIG